MLTLWLRFFVLTPLFVFGTVGIGVTLVRWALAKRPSVFPIALGPLVGFGAASLWLSWAGRVLPWWIAVAMWTVAGIAAFISVLASRRQAMEHARTFRWLWFGVFPILFLLALSGGVFDEGWHFPLAGLIANGHWPARFPFDPALPLSYHFGFDIVVAATRTAGWYVPLASDFWTAILQTSLLGVVYLFISDFLSSARDRILATGLWYFAGSFGWIMRPFRALLPRVFSEMPPFISTIGNALGLLTYTKSMLFAMGFVLSVLLLVRHRELLTRRVWWLLGFGLLASALSSETLVVSAIAWILIGLCFELRGKARWTVLVVAALSGTLMLFQGGLFTDVFLRFWNGTADAYAKAGSIQWRSTPIFKTFGGAFDLSSAWSWIRILLEWGGQFILLLCALSGWRRWNRVEKFALAGALLSFLPPFLLMTPNSAPDMLRFFGHAFLITNLLGAIAFIRMIASWGKKIALSAVLCFGGIVSIVLSNVPLIPWMAPFSPNVVSVALWDAYLKENASLPKNSVLWISVARIKNETPNEIRQIPLAFGVYAKSCYDYFRYDTSDLCDRFYDQPTEQGLKDLHVTHVLLTSQWMKAHPESAWQKHLVLERTFTAASWTSLFPNSWRTGHDEPLLLYRVNL